MPSVSLRITHLPSDASAKRKPLPFARVEASSIVIDSQIPSDRPLNEHLVWLWGMLQNERRHLKALQAEGARVTVSVIGARPPIEIAPNGAEMLHLLGATLRLA